MDMTELKKMVENKQGLYPNVPKVGSKSCITVCPACHSKVQTKVKYEAGMKTHIFAILLCGLCICCLPHCINSCKNAEHSCPECGYFLGVCDK